MVTIREVAKAAGFSPSTVSMVLNNAPLAKYIPPTTKATIRRVAKQMNYQPNVFARSLRSRQTNTIGVIVFDITDPYCTYILRGIENELNASSMLYLLSDAQNNDERFENNLELLVHRRIEGLLLVANSLHTNPEILNATSAADVPTVVIGRNDANKVHSNVSVNNELGGYLALQHIYQLGHRDVAFIRGPRAIVDSVLRWKGIEKFAGQSGLVIDHRLVVEVETPQSGFSAGVDAVGHLLSSGKRFSAIVAFDDLTALGAIRRLTEAGIEVPRDCSVIGFDDIDAAQYYNPPLTTVQQPMEEIGREGARLLLQAVLARRKKRTVSKVHPLLEPKLVVRSSTRAITAPSSGRRHALAGD